MSEKVYSLESVVVWGGGVHGRRISKAIKQFTVKCAYFVTVLDSHWVAMYGNAPKINPALQTLVQLRISCDVATFINA